MARTRVPAKAKLPPHWSGPKRRRHAEPYNFIAVEPNQKKPRQ